MEIRVNPFGGQDLTIMKNGLMIWSDVDSYKKYFGYLSRSHYYNARCTFNFINQVKRR